MRHISLLFVLIVVAISVQADVHSLPSRTTRTRRVSSPRRHHRRAHLRRLRYYGPPVAPELRGSRDSLLKQNEEIDKAGLTRIENDEQLEQLEQRGVLVPLTETEYLTVSHSLKENR